MKGGSGLQAFSLRRDAHLANASMATHAPRVPWDVFYRNHLDISPGQHTAIIGPNGRGKTELQNQILPKFPFVALFATKPQDSTMDRLIKTGGYVKLQQWRSLSPFEFPRRVIWPDATKLNAKATQRAVFAEAFDKIFREGGRPAHSPTGWALAIDELWYVINVLGLDEQVKQFLLQGRSLGHSLILATQRPKAVPLEVYDQSTHLFFFRNPDENNIDRMAEIASIDSGLVKFIIPRLETFQVLYVNALTGAMMRTRTPVPRNT